MDKFAGVLDRYRELVGDFDAFLDAVRRPGPVHGRVNTLKAPVAGVAAALGELGVGVEPEPWCAFLLRLAAPEGTALGATLPHALGHLYLQSASSAVSALALEARPGDRVLDLCAAPGSKSTLLAQTMGDAGCLVANEPSSSRVRSLTANLERLGVTCAVVTSYAGQHFPKRHAFDRVLVDAPCSGEGTWRGPNARPKPVRADLREHLAAQQRSLLERAYEVLRPGGALVYSTCTYAPEENECVLGPFLEASGARVVPLPVAVAGAPGLTGWEGRRFAPELAHARRLYPHDFDSEGFFVARLARPEGS